MKNIVHIAAECFPAAKSGGLGDVLGSLPKYQSQKNQSIHVIIPYYYSDFVEKQEWETLLEDKFFFGNHYFPVTILKEKNNVLGFHFYMVSISEMFPRENIYGYADDADRFILFQNVVLYFLQSGILSPDIIHCHDQHTAFIPFLTKYGLDFPKLRNIPTIFTIHNGEYSGEMHLSKAALLSTFSPENRGYLEYNGRISPLIVALKCAYFVTTVSEGYLQELQNSDSPLGLTLQQEKEKSLGILNGIDVENWNPSLDEYLDYHYDQSSFKKGKKDNKNHLLQTYGLEIHKPLFVYIGRMAREKGADYLAFGIDLFLNENTEANFFIIGSGDPALIQTFESLYQKYPENVRIYIGYNEGLARKLYASSDYLIMPSRVEPCGLNQMYAMHYGSIPIVRSTGGLKDTVHPIEDGGEGFTFFDAHSYELSNALQRAFHYYEDESERNNTIRRNMQIDFSWRQSAFKYQEIYNLLLKIQYNAS